MKQNAERVRFRRQPEFPVALLKEANIRAFVVAELCVERDPDITVLTINVIISRGSIDRVATTLIIAYIFN